MTYMQLEPMYANGVIENLGCTDLDLIGGGSEGVTNMITGFGGMGAGVATIGGGLEVAGVAGAMIVGGGAVVAAAGVGLLAYGAYEYFSN